jgi:hypothetical protein
VRFRRFVTLFVTATAAVVIGPAAASAEPYPAGTPTSSVSDGTVSDGGFVTFTGGGFLPFEVVSIDVTVAGSDSSAAFAGGAPGGFTLAALSRLTTTANAQGTFSIKVKLTEVGKATLVATGLTSGVSITQVIQVMPGSDSRPAPNQSRRPRDGQPRDGQPRDDQSRDGQPVAGGPGAALPTTGQPGPPLTLTLAGGVGATLTGGMLLWFARNRRRRH